ncbi:nitrogenase component 1 [Kineothrix sedimenti]|uniref:Nitrogenase component 1 n=1 Tax=Kineothrix sedimenti TaxID=3123317 RepID=A0ABZ3EZP8_9FIRM
MKDAFGHLKPLSEIRNNAGIPFLTPDVAPGTHCPMRMASVICEEIEGLSSLLVGMPECTTYSRMFSQSAQGRKGELHWLYVLDSREIVFGCRDGVIEAVRKMEEKGAKDILVIGTCIPDLIGEDFESIAYELEAETNSKTACILLGQFKNISYPAGSYKTMEALVMLMQPKQRNQRSVNVLGRSPKEEHSPKPKLFAYLEESGYQLRYLGPKSSMEEIKEAPDAVLNIVVSPYTLPMARKMEQKFGIECVALQEIYDTPGIEQAYRRVEDILGCRIVCMFREDEQALRMKEEAAGKLLRDKRFLMTLRVDLPIPLTGYLIQQFGMYPVLLHLEEFYPEDHRYVSEIKKLGYDPLVCRIVNESGAYGLLEKLSPDLGIGYLADAEKCVTWVDNMLDFYGMIGYERTMAILDRIMGALDQNKGEEEECHGLA